MHSFDKVLVERRSDDIESLIFLRIHSKSASSGPPIGPILGQYGIPAGPFCAEFNDRTSIFKSNIELFVTISLYRSGLYDFLIELPSISFLLKRTLRMSVLTRVPGWVPAPRDEFGLFNVPARRPRWWYRSKLSDKECRRCKVITAYILYEILRYKSRFEILRLSDYSDYKRGLGTIKSMGLHLI